jgi:hypothetical protein
LIATIVARQKWRLLRMLTPVHDFVAGVELCPDKPDSAHGLQEILRIEKNRGGPFIPPHGFVFLSMHAPAFAPLSFGRVQSHCFASIYGRVRCIRITTCTRILGTNYIPTGITRPPYNSERCVYTN